MTVLLRLPVLNEAPQEAAEEEILVQRPKTRADCLPGGSNAERPCPFVSCTHHLFRFLHGIRSEDDLDTMVHTCTLDVADKGGVTLEEVGVLLGLTRERIRQIEAKMMSRLKLRPALIQLVEQ